MLRSVYIAKSTELVEWIYMALDTIGKNLPCHLSAVKSKSILLLKSKDCNCHRMQDKGELSKQNQNCCFANDANRGNYSQVAAFANTTSSPLHGIFRRTYKQNPRQGFVRSRHINYC
jgi:hypothetical protein